MWYTFVIFGAEKDLDVVERLKLDVADAVVPRADLRCQYLQTTVYSF